MKTVFFIRHAKSSWNDPSLKDHDRPLNKRGFRDAPLMAMALKSKVSPPDLLLSSTAKRAKSTALYFQEALQLGDDKLLLDKQLYHAYPETIEQIIQSQQDHLNSLAIFAHNPGLTMIANLIQGELIENVPTTGIVHSVCAVTKWADWSLVNASQKAFWYPKMFV